MREDVQDEDPAGVVIDSRDQAVLVAFDVEDGSSADNICVAKITSDVGQVLPLGALRDSVPVHQGNGCIGVLPGEIEDRPPADHPHQYSLQNVNRWVKRVTTGLAIDVRALFML